MSESEPCRPEAANLLEVQRRMPWVILQQAETLVGDFLDLSRQRQAGHRLRRFCCLA